MRPIDADALIKILEPHSMRNGAVLGWHSGLIDAVIDEIRKMPTIGGWISVKKRLPAEEDYKPCRDYPEGVVLWFNGFESGFGWYYKSTKEWADSNDRGITNVTHWMPFPERPKKTE